MSKKSADPSDAEDYLNQLQWGSKVGYRRPWYLIPKWKYKPVRLIKYQDPALITIFVVGIFIIITGYLIRSIIVDHSGLSIFVLIVVVIIGLILFLAMRDARKTLDDDNDKGTDA